MYLADIITGHTWLKAFSQPAFYTHAFSSTFHIFSLASQLLFILHRYIYTLDYYIDIFIISLLSFLILHI